jgi:hypothetical protein
MLFDKIVLVPLALQAAALPSFGLPEVRSEPTRTSAVSIPK